MKILFSPVGNTDFNELVNAPTFRIAKFVKPNSVVLYATKQMLEQVDEFAELLVEELKVQVEVIKDEQNDNPDEYDYSFKKLKEELEKLSAENPNCEIILNAGSGTPAIKSSLMVLNEFGNFKTKAFQAKNPQYSDEVVEIDNYPLSEQIILNQVETLIKNYNYSGALKLAENLRNVDQTSKNYINGAYLRSILDYNGAAGVFGGTEFRFDQNKDQLSEYLSSLELKLKRDEVADFSRAVSPAITAIFLKVLENAGLETASWTSLKKVGKISKKSITIDFEKIATLPKREQKILNTVFNDVKRDKPFFYNSHLLEIIKKYISNPKTVDNCEKLSSFESNIRNMAAHEMTKIDSNRVKKATDQTPEELLKLMASLGGVQLGLYDRINEMILEHLQMVG